MVTKAPGEMLLGFEAVSAKVGLKRTKIYDLMKRGDFPKPVHVTPAASRWRLSELENWIETRAPAA